MKEIDKIYESLLFSIPKNNLGMEYKYGFQQGIALFKKAIDNSTVSSGQIRKIGHWIIDGHHIKCNQCGELICNTDREGNAIPRNFCPNCGTKMDV